LRGFCCVETGPLLEQVREIEARAPFRRMTTRSGGTLSVAMTNCGALGWVSDPGGYRYDPVDPQTGDPWPPMPAPFADLAARAAIAAGFGPVEPNACLINRYEPGNRLSLHQDRDELDMAVPIVSVSLGLPAVFLFGGLQRHDPARRFRLESGDVVVWGGPSRLAFHGVASVVAGEHRLTGRTRINLTFRTARLTAPHR
jgi:alkylated DNA repair protein (DNA oxidative demethylase)